MKLYARKVYAAYRQAMSEPTEIFTTLRITSGADIGGWRRRRGDAGRSLTVYADDTMDDERDDDASRPTGMTSDRNRDRACHHASTPIVTQSRLSCHAVIGSRDSYGRIGGIHRTTDAMVFVRAITLDCR